MKTIFDNVSYDCSKIVTKSYSTSFSLATKMLAPSIRADIYNIYGFVRFADEIVDTFHDYDKAQLFDAFEKDMERAIADKISLNPILNAFQHTYHKYDIPHHLVESFMKSMRMDLTKKNYETFDEYREYIYGSADVVGLMCLCVFVDGDKEKYERLKESAMALGSAFQKVNFLRDLKADYEDLNRTYFPDTDLLELDEASKRRIVNEIKADFALGYAGIVELPEQAKFGVYTAYRYYKKLLQKLQSTPPLEIKNTRIRVPNYQKFGLLAQSYVNYKLQLVQ
ncbi:MAG: phytoene/squalene synthase family protein [Allomuricauda sp.]|uniref:Phytoene/squalene synthase family protein n=1 Tax=Flagellimonas sp. MMG031 TaxID=3158549 RepID=A0AAU7N2C6_9FLAO|nr:MULTISPECIES: phytoene/squalene synthase family protein [unclassified Allomuricauda]MBO6590470.1 phytoene/squalene synthase family protein [Allomuricauda sp.]MBO6620073.1 phytoene/squalene synthase family protein [Allomuricauda sp.]MBO6645991.1 phytoene/squalene synthase family protein [Allomuricauda sp.]MBO6748411.1 phytoene/squalene synthase family protein [Allomuricauda sp.]MBO6829592.1 phytoene/squalene synthase family protein [Allomuricauda sp.]